jgi:F-type H+-transporting ATPase subunit b
MLIDWFTVGAQVFNFLVLVWLLKRFLYKPILHAIDEREKRIAAELADAAAQKAEAQKERKEFQHKNEEFDRQRSDLLSKAQDEVKSERSRLLDEARQAADALRVKRQDALQREQQGLNDEITRRTREEVFAIAGKTLTDLAGTSLEARMSDVFVRRLRELDGEAKERFAKALETADDPALVRSAFDLQAEQRAAIQQALNETFSADIQIRFETAPNVISGIELTVNGRKVAWSIADHLASLGKSVDALLKEQSKPEGEPEAKPEGESEADGKPEAKADGESEAKPEGEPEALEQEAEHS